ncbi:MAG: putative FtsK/SpoIIIE family protein [Chloroflexi bacterium]|jgi:S-DNA-T family DNA segregation ATPase FtsK/SpoIIIE|nr:putative FtsK/SpoIIIE family protein [Chloroflexota bacterium]
MQIVFAGVNGELELELRINRPSATVADLDAALPATGGERHGGLLIGDALVHADLSLTEAGLHEGAVVQRPGGTRGGSPDTTSGFRLRVAGGLGAGADIPLARGSLVLGRDPACDLVFGDPTVSRRHARLTVSATEVLIEDMGSTGGTWVEGARISGPTPAAIGAVVELGNVQFTLGRQRTDDRPAAVDPLRHVGAGGTIPFNRPPRSAPPPPGPLLEVPVLPTGQSKPVFNVASIAAPMVMSLVMVVALHSYLYLFFGLLTPLMAVANWYEGKRRSRLASRRDTKRFQEELARFSDQLSERRHGEVARRREASPDLAEVVRRATLPSVHLWERRPRDADFLQLTAGLGDLPWQPPVPEQRVAPAPEVGEALSAHATVRLVPVPVDLAQGGVVGIVGDRAPSLALARALVCQVAVHHGPADVAVAVLCGAPHQADWDWTKWLPHTRAAAGSGRARLLAGSREDAEGLLRGLLAGGPRDGATTLAVIDDEGLTEGRNAPARALLRGGAGPVAGIVLASSEDRLPALCNTIIELKTADGGASLRRPQLGQRVDGFVIGGAEEPVARGVARALARFEDPELQHVGSGLPDVIGLLPLLDPPGVDPPAILARWSGGGPDPGAAAPIGVSEDGPFVVDLVRDGPHCLVGGTTGSGKSELLRSLVASLAVAVDPEHLTFVLIDYKGGSSFDECSRLPHAVGMVTDLDAQLGERALRCLEAELRYRERVLREAGALDLPDYLRRAARGRGDAEPLPRLVVVIDEFATMVKELPDFIDSLVGVAQRGRSLGVHLILATQKPSGAVNDNIRTNTKLRIALRVEDAGDSTDVIDVPAAATIAGKGRAYVRLRPGEVVLIQAALVTGVTGQGTVASVALTPFQFGGGGAAGSVPSGPLAGERSDLSRLVEDVGAAFATAGMRSPRRPWPEPLPAEIDLEEVCPAGQPVADGGTIRFAVADDPDQQDQYPFGWDTARGNLLMYGVVGSGTTTALASLALALARTRSADSRHLYVLDFGAGELSPLAGLPHTGAYIGATERERQTRLIRTLRAELDRRKQQRPEDRLREPDVVVLLDNFGAFSTEFSDPLGMEAKEQFNRVYADGPEVGIRMVISADRAGAIPAQLTSLTPQRFVFRLSDAQDYGIFGLGRRQAPALTPGRALVAETSQLIQVARAASLAEAVASTAAHTNTPTRRAAPIEALPDEVAVADVAGALRLGPGPWFLPLGVGAANLAPTGLTVHEGEHILVAGPARSGKSTALCSIAGMVAQAGSGVVVVGIATRRSPLRTCTDLDRVATSPAEVAAVLAPIAGDPRPHLVLIDDADSMDDTDRAIAALLTQGRPDVRVIAAGRADVLRSLFNHWTQSIRRSKLGLLLRPGELDGELLGAALPRRQWVAARVGRGYLVDNGTVELAQVAADAATGAATE